MSGTLTPWRWNALLLVFIIGALGASVIIPARATSRIIDLFQQLNDVIEPARRVATEVQAGLQREATELENYALSGDTEALAQYQAISAQNDRQLALLRVLTGQISGAAAADVNEVYGNLAGWRELSARERESRLAAMRLALTELQLRLADENQNRREEVQVAGRLSLVTNALLVLAALAAITAIIGHMLRERRLMSILRERATRETSLRSAAEALAAAYTLDDVAHEIARTAVAVLPAHGAFVVHADKVSEDRTNLVVHSTAGSQVPAPGTTCRVSGSPIERAILAQEPMISALQQSGPLMCNVSMSKSSIAALIIPLHDGQSAKGALVVLSATGFASEDMIWARTFRHITTLAYEKVRLLDDANQGREKLENVMDSRSRLMRGFSHDVKNPLGAADGYAALILDGVYGKLTRSQQDSLERVRKSINVALALIDDLNDFARAEAGKIKLNIGTVDVAQLTHTVGAQYGASARAKRLELDVDVAPDLPPIETDAARLLQVVSNLLSNGIKYTDSGSVRLRVRECADSESALQSGIRFEITDTGPGMAEAEQTSIFDEFSRLEKTKHPGAGLGLPISKLLAEMLGGSITVESEVGVGSTFSLWIPERVGNTISV
jgi:signal transduction histidine kinase